MKDFLLTELKSAKELAAKLEIERTRVAAVIDFIEHALAKTEEPNVES